MKVKEESESVDLKLKIQKTKIMAAGAITSWQVDGTQWETNFEGSKITADGNCSHEIKKDTCSLEEKLDQPEQHIKKQRYHFDNKCPSSQSCGFSSSHVWVWELEYKES